MNKGLKYGDNVYLNELGWETLLKFKKKQLEHLNKSEIQCKIKYICTNSRLINITVLHKNLFITNIWLVRGHVYLRKQIYPDE